jgi:hypothetical protein
VSWSVSISNTAESGTNVEESIAKAKAGLEGYLGSLDADLRETVEATVDAQLACIGALAGAPNETRIVSASAWGHLNDDGSGTFGMTGALTAPVAATDVDELDPDVPTDPVPTHPDDPPPTEDDASVAHQAPQEI